MAVCRGLGRVVVVLSEWAKPIVGVRVHQIMPDGFTEYAVGVYEIASSHVHEAPVGFSIIGSQFRNQVPCAHGTWPVSFSPAFTAQPGEGLGICSLESNGAL